ncbi:MAG TPA: ComEC/Rec2 family competence protein [Alphaproteobacteria bacterium]
MSDAAAGTGPAAGLVGRLGATLADRLAAERERLALWLPVAFGTGIGVYFALPREPAMWLGPAIAIAAGLLAALGRRSALAVIVGIAVAAMGLGLSVAQLRSRLVAAPMIEKRIGPADIEGRIAAVEVRPEGRRIMIDRLHIAGLAADRTPAQVRLVVRRAPEQHLVPGDLVSLRAVLLPPPAPAAPGAYDFQRDAWFARLGGVGFTAGEIQRRGRADPDDYGWTLRLNAARQTVVERTLAVIPGPAGPVAAALLTGEQGAIPPEAMAWMRDSGLAHLLSISGLHISLVAGIVFFAIRRGLALIPHVALRYPIKKWSAVAAFLAITFYMLFASPGVPTQRSWLMTSIVLFAILIDRTAISMRLIAWAAFAVLLLLPESLLGPSFQMSFAAVVALIAVWEAMRRQFTAWRVGAGLMRRAALELSAVCLTTIIAGFASAPYALYHFNRFTLYGLAANLLAVPLTSVWVMPWAVLAFLLFPFGLERLALVPLGWGCDLILVIGREVAGWNGAVALFPAMPVWGLAMTSLGGLWLCLWKTRWRVAGLPIVLLGLSSIALERSPDVLISGDAKLLAVRGADGLLEVSAQRASKLTRETWLRRAGQDQAEPWPSAGTSGDGALTCDPLGCIYRVRGQVVALVRDPAALAEDCLAASVVVATVPVRRACPSAQVVVDRFSVWRDGGHAIWLDPSGTRVESVRAARGERPWVPGLPSPRRAAEGPRPDEVRAGD